jgi:bacterioferritin
MHEKSIDLLNHSVADELSAIHQYMYFHFHCDDQGYVKLAALFKRTAITEMMHVEKLAERILFLGGDVNMEPKEPVKRVNEVKDMLQMACAMEEASAKDYNKLALECSANADSVTKKIFEELVGDEEGHYDAFDKELDNLKRFGDKYLALQSMGQDEISGHPA